MINKKTDSEDILFFLILLFIGADLLSVKLFDLTVRIVNIFILISFVLILKKNNKNYLPRKLVISSSLLILAMLLSLPFSYDSQKTIAYIIWFIFFIYIMAPFFYYYSSKNCPIHVLNLWFLTFRIQVVLLVIELIYLAIVGEVERPHIWFYEPSYAAIYFSLYFGANIYLRLNSNNYRNRDLYFSILGLLILVSATAMFALIVGISIAIILSKHKIKYLIISLSFLIIFFLFIMFFFGDSDYYRLTFGFLEYSGNVVDLFNNIMFRSGTRVIRFLWGWDAFLSHPFTGIGFGADQKYTEIASIPDVAQMYITPWDSAWGNPFVNPFIEALGTMGIFGFIFLLYSFYLLLYLYKESKKIIYFEAQYVLAIIVGVLALIGTLQMEGTFLRYYLWSSYALAWGMVARLKNIK